MQYIFYFLCHVWFIIFKTLTRKKPKNTVCVNPDCFSLCNSDELVHQESQNSAAEMLHRVPLQRGDQVYVHRSHCSAGKRVRRKNHRVPRPRGNGLFTQLCSLSLCLPPSRPPFKEREFLKNYVQRIVDVRPNLVLVEKTVSRIAQDMLLEHGITLVINVKPVGGAVYPVRHSS